MRGFLQRLAASVMNPGMAVQPLAGSVFTRHAGPAASSTFSYPEVASVVRSSQEATAPPPAVSESVSPRREDFVVNAGVRQSMAQVIAPTETESPRVEPLIRTAPQSTRSETTPPYQPAPEISVETVAPESRAESRLVEREVVRERGELPLRDRLVEVTPGKPRETRSALRPGADRRTPSQPAAAQAAEPDIQIHIGRIEVTAVPPAQTIARPVSSAPRKRMSLDEYLRRGDARSR